MKVGDTVWLRDDNRRQYDARGKRLERHAFFQVEIVAENRASWITKGDGYRIDKKTGRLRKPHRDGYFGLSPNVWGVGGGRRRVVLAAAGEVSDLASSAHRQPFTASDHHGRPRTHRCGCS